MSISERYTISLDPARGYLFRVDFLDEREPVWGRSYAGAEGLAREALGEEPLSFDPSRPGRPHVAALLAEQCRGQQQVAAEARAAGLPAGYAIVKDGATYRVLLRGELVDTRRSRVAAKALAHEHSGKAGK